MAANQRYVYSTLNSAGNTQLTLAQYFGTFDVDEPSRTVIHHLQSALIPSWVGTDQRRKYEFSGGNQLIMFNTASQAAYRLVWQRDGK